MSVTIGVTSVRCAALALTSALALAACGSRAAGSEESTDISKAAGTNRQEAAMARAIAIDTVRGQQAEISSATFVVRHGTVGESQANVGPACTSGRLIEVKLIGTFPHIATTGHPVPSGEHADFIVTAVNVTGDATSGRVCRTGVQTGVVKPEPGATVIVLH